MTNTEGTKGNESGQGTGGQGAPDITPTAEQVEKQDAKMHAAECRRELAKARVPATRKKMTVDELRLACEAAILPTDGKRDVLIERLGGPRAKTAEKAKPAKKYITKTWVEGKTVCAVCHETVRVAKVETGTDDAGRVIRTRTLQCNGRHRHTYKLAEITKPDA